VRERSGHLRPVPRSLFRLLGEHGGAERVERGRHRGAALAQPRHLVEQDLAEDGHEVHAGERRPAAQAFEQHTAEGEHVGARVELRLAAGLLRRHVPRGPDERPRLRHPRP
jgi:hypothetical protein